MSRSMYKILLCVVSVCIGLALIVSPFAIVPLLIALLMQSVSIVVIDVCER